MSLQEYVPPLDLASRGMPTPSQVMDDISSWSAKAREIIVGASNHAGTDSLPSFTGRANFEADVASALQARLLQLLQQKLSGAAQALLKEAKATITSLERDASSLGNGADAGAAAVEMPLDALFHPVEAQNASSIRTAPLDADDASNPIRSSRAYISALQDDLRGRSNKVESLASLYETPLSAMSRELKIYRAELEGDERFADASAAIQASFDSLIASSRSDIETGLSDLLDRSDGIGGWRRRCSHVVSDAAYRGLGQPLTGQQDPERIESSPAARHENVGATLEASAGAKHIRGVFTRPSGTRASARFPPDRPSRRRCCRSSRCFSESIVELGPGTCSLYRRRPPSPPADAASLTSLLQCEPGALAELIGADTRLHRVRLAHIATVASPGCVGTSFAA
ncbi:hypothetical protein L1887_63192 [Cichorium endivia]|nr:hypothetical protein L1887_63192 [Cichorium endivia]